LCPAAQRTESCQKESLQKCDGRHKEVQFPDRVRFFRNKKTRAAHYQRVFPIAQGFVDSRDNLTETREEAVGASGHNPPGRGAFPRQLPDFGRQKKCPGRNRGIQAGTAIINA
jgi:hypothetical protein